MKQEVPPVLQFQILQLALELPASKFSWFRVQVKTFERFIFFIHGLIDHIGLLHLVC